MADVERLLHEFIAEDRSGGDADPLAYLRRARGTDRAELEALIDAYLARAPRRPIDLTADRPAAARRQADELIRAVAGRSGWWPAMLPRLRAAAQLRRSEVVDRLAATSARPGARPRSAPTTTPWSRGRCLPPVCRTACSKRSQRSWARPLTGCARRAAYRRPAAGPAWGRRIRADRYARP